MTDNEDLGRPFPTLLIMLLGSFVLMILSGIFFGLGLPEDWARALFMATVIIWMLLGAALIVQGFKETREIARSTPSPEGQEAENDG